VAAPLTDSQRLATILGGAYGDGADGAIAHWAVAVVSAFVRSYTRLTITPVSDATAVLQGGPSRRLLLGERPVTAVASVTLDGALLPATDYRWTRAGALYRDAGWLDASREVVVVFSYGFAVVPADLEAVVETAATRLIANPAQWRSEGAEDGGAVRVAEAAGRFTLAELAVLNRYRRRTA
jgi:hypothetical protein